MKNSNLPGTARATGRLLTAMFVLLLAPFISRSQTAVGMSSQPGDNATQIGPTVSIAPVAGMQAGDLVVIYAQYRNTGVTLSMANTGGQIWNIADDNAGGTGTQTYGIFWARFDGTWTGPNPSVTVGTGNQAMTAAMYVYRPSNSNNTWALNTGPTLAAPNNAVVATTIASTTTTANNGVAMAFWGNSTPTLWGALAGIGWAKHTGAAQFRNTSTTGQSHSHAYKLMPTAGATGTVTQTRGTAGTLVTQTAMISWVEVSRPANDYCAAAVPLTSALACNVTNGTVVNATYTSGGGVPGGCAVAAPDVWYSFVAYSTNPQIITTLATGTGTRRTELYEGTCGALTALNQCSGNNNTLSATGLTIGQTYYIRVYSENYQGFTFTICVDDAVPANDLCTAPQVITHSSACTPTQGRLYGATVTANPPIAPCTGPVVSDVWYSFVAQDFNATVTLANVGSGIGGARIQLLNASCAAGAVNYGCGTNTITTSNLTIGTTYYIRVYNSTGSLITTNGDNATFDICVTYPNPDPPSNDDCSGAVTLQTNPSCSNIYGNMANATLSGYAIASNCASAATYDVWYKFKATTTNPVITLSGGANNFTNRGIQLLTGTCGTTPTFTSIACNATSISATGLTIGNTYWIRVYSTTAGAAPSANALYQLCIAAAGQPLRFGNSYVNVTKKTVGGVVEPGDILEIRMTIAHTVGTMYNMRYVDNIPTNTVYDSTSNINIITNEGIVVPGKSFTWAGGDDGAMYTGITNVTNPYNIRMNLAFGASTVANVANTGTTNTGANGQMVATTDAPKGTSNSMLFATAFRVKVTGAVGSTITLGAGRFYYATSSGGADNILNATQYQILISSPMSLCANASGVNMSQETGGTFGTGTDLNRSYDLATPIPGYTFVNISQLQSSNDGTYSIVKNTSPRAGIDPNAERVGTCPTALPSQQACAQRMHGGHWEVAGDHSGTATLAGNAPTANGNTGGYMLMVNADYVASEVFSQQITGLCPNTYYEFSAWFRNLCATCGNDYTTGNNYSPTRQPGVLPNLTFAMDGVDRYSSGEIPYIVSGGNNGWVKRGFVFITGPSQVSATFSIRNNSQGGGGNDWAMDDISVATCLPNMRYSPSLNPTVCQGNSITIRDTVTSFFSNYQHYKWQRSAAGGGPWTDIAGTTGSQTPVAFGSEWRYITTYTVPVGMAQLVNNGDRYRVIVATTSGNLSDASCNVTDGVSIIDVNVIDCTPALKTELVSFSGRLNDNRGLLTWTTQNEEKGVSFIVERSKDGRNFEAAGTINSNNNTNPLNHYLFADPQSIVDKAWYRLTLVSVDGSKKYSSVILLKNDLPDFDFVKVVNPFSQKLEFDIAVSSNSLVNIDLIDMTGKTVRTDKQMLYAGTNSLNVFNTESLPAGVYTLRVIRNEKIITRRIVKTN